MHLERRGSIVLGVVLAVGLLGCGANNPKYVVGGHTLVEQDSGYVSTDGHDYCAAAGVGQIKLTIVDYFPICGAAIAATAPGGARDPLSEHNELELDFITAGHGDPKQPYEVSVPDCVTGPAGPAYALFNHYAANAKTPDTIMAQSGELFLASIDPTGKDPATGSFSLDFGPGGQGGKISGVFKTLTCNAVAP